MITILYGDISEFKNSKNSKKKKEGAIFLFSGQEN